MWYQILAYIKFIFSSSNQHGVHSPFVYELVTKCFYDKKRYPEYHKLKTYRNHLLNSKQRITVKDFGAGSRVFKSNERNVKDIAKNAGISSKRAELLFRLSRYLQVRSALELGTSLGMGTAALAMASDELNVATIEGCPETSSVAKNTLNQFDIRNYRSVVGNFDEVLSEEKENFDLIYFDGNHQKEATLSYFEQLVEQTHNDTVFIFDDIHWSKDMLEAWKMIQEHPKVTVTIDTFFWGFVFFRKEQAKEHFTIRL